MLLAVWAAAGEVAKSATGVDLASLLQSNLLGYGLLGIMFGCLIFRKFVVPEWTLRKEEERHAEESAAKDERIAQLETQVERLQDLTAKELMPALGRATDINARFVEEMTHRRYAGDRDGRG